MKLFHLSLTTLMIRFYLMMAIIIIAGFSGIWLLSLLALPVFFSGLMGLQFNKMKVIRKTHRSGRPDLRTTGRQVTAHA